jgi:putative zinc finger/helix-turn-helix YgiT family protein
MTRKKCPGCGGEGRVVHGDWPLDEWGIKGYVLLGVEIIQCDQCKAEMPILKSVNRILRAITEAIIRKPYRLTGQEVRFLRKRLRLTQDEFAREIHVDKTTVSKWENDEDPVGLQSDLLLRLLAALDDEELQRHVRPDIKKAFEQMREREQPKRLRVEIDSREMTFAYA